MTVTKRGERIVTWRVKIRSMSRWEYLKRHEEALSKIIEAAIFIKTHRNATETRTRHSYKLLKFDLKNNL